MSTDATTPSTPEMDCERAVRDEIAEGYVLGRLREEDRAAFEAHYFECARCFEEVRLLQAMQRELQRSGSEHEVRTSHSAWWKAAGMAAVIVMTVVAGLWIRSDTPRVPSSGTRPSTPPATADAEAPHATEPAAPAASLEQLARVEAPAYEPRTLRGPSDEAMQRFERGMDRYRTADYAGAARDLRAAHGLDPEAAHIGFFLGISYLMSGQDQAAIDRLRATIALGDSPYREDARFYLAKAFLRRGDLKAAQTQLKAVVKLRGSRSLEAQNMLREIERLAPR